MAKKTLATKYRPKVFDDIVEQATVKTILMQQLETNTFKNAYLFCGPAGDGKTTTARIFANEINKGRGNPIEMDAASNSGVDDVRGIIAQAQTKSLDSEYKCFIIDECHSISNTGWQAFLKLIEEPPAKSIFIFCTTDPQKIPKTILSRVQRFDFQRISQQGIVDRLHYILEQEYCEPGYKIVNDVDEALEYIAKIADGGMRDAITNLDKCIGYSTELTLENVVNALGVVDYDNMMSLTNAILHKEEKTVISIIENIHNAGKDLKTFIRQYINFLLDVNKYAIGVDDSYLSIPLTSEIIKWLNNLSDNDYDIILNLLDCIVKLNANIKYSQYVKADVEATIILFILGGSSRGRAE